MCVNFLGKPFVVLVSGTVRPTKLKLGSHVDNGLMYVSARIRLLLLIRPFIFHSLQFSNNIKLSSHFS